MGCKSSKISNGYTIRSISPLSNGLKNDILEYENILNKRKYSITMVHIPLIKYMK